MKVQVNRLALMEYIFFCWSSLKVNPSVAAKRLIQCINIIEVFQIKYEKFCRVNLRRNMHKSIILVFVYDHCIHKNYLRVFHAATVWKYF